MAKGVNTPVSRITGNRVCLTFDDGPDPRHTPLILDQLAEAGTKATFFVSGWAAQAWPDLIRRIVAQGHALGNHSYSHRHPRWLSNAVGRQEVLRANAVISAITGQAPGWFRPPYGYLHRGMLEQAREQEMTTVLWSRSAIDWGPLGTRAGVARRLKMVQPGDILLMHDGRSRFNHPQVVAELLPQLLSDLRQQGLIPVTVGEGIGA